MSIEFLIIQIAILIFSVVVHEVSHGVMADRLGDPTARYMGRLTLNPVKHLDLLGSFLVPGFLILIGSPVLFGWAKPVPYNPHNLRNWRWDPAKVAAAGPISNLLIAVIFGLVLRFSLVSGPMALVFFLIVSINILLAIFNLVPIPPLDGSKILFAVLPARYERFKLQLERYGFMLVLFFLFFFVRLLFPVIEAIYMLIVGAPFGFF